MKAFCCMLTMCAPVFAGTVGFDDSPPGELPPSWQVRASAGNEPHWNIAAEAAAPSPPQVLKQVGTPVPGTPFSVCLKTAPLLTDGFVEVKFKTAAGAKGQVAGLIWRAEDPDNYYLCCVDTAAGSIALYKNVDGQRSELAPTRQPKNRVPHPGRWTTLRVDFKGPGFTVTLGGEVLVRATDDSFSAAGQLGLWAASSQTVLFDDFRFR